MPQPLAGGHPQAVPAVADDGGGGHVAGFDGLMDETANGRIVAVQSAFTADPQSAIGILVQRLHIVVAQAVGVAGIVLEDGDAVAVEAVQAGLRADPDETLAVLDHAGDGFLRQALLDAEVFEAQAERSAVDERTERQQKQAAKPRHTHREN